jgi:hypothetical protein
MVIQEHYLDGFQITGGVLFHVTSAHYYIPWKHVIYDGLLFKLKANHSVWLFPPNTSSSTRLSVFSDHINI